MNNNLNEIINELTQAGSSNKEAEELALFSKNVSNLLKVERSEDLKTKFLQSNIKPAGRTYFQKKYSFALLSVFLLLLGISSVVSAQKSLPGEPLYPIKIASENIASSITPSFKGEVLKRRSEEIKDLSGKNNSVEFHKTVDDYEKVLKEDAIINAEEIDESRRNLEKAHENSLEENKEDIERVILQTEERRGELEKNEVKGENTGPDNNREDNEGDNNRLNLLDED